MKKRKQTWFKKVRGSYLPSSWQGWLLYALYATYVLGIVAYVVVKGYDRWEAVFWVFPNWVAALVVMTWVAKGRS